MDNAPMESRLHALKTELVHPHPQTTRDDARRDLFASSETTTTRQRLHSALGFRAPEQTEALAA